MKTYTNTININGIDYTHSIEADNCKEALVILKDRKRNLKKGRKITGHLTLS